MTLPIQKPSPLQSCLELLQRGDTQEAERACRKLLRKQPADPQTLSLLGSILLQMGQAKEARDILARALKIAPADPQTRLSLAMAEADCGNGQRALQLLAEAAQRTPTDATIPFQLGNLLDDLGRKDEALEAFAQAIALAPQFTEAHRNRGILLLGQGRYVDALANLDAACESTPTDFSSRYNRARVLLALRRTQEALADLDQAVSLQPQHAEAHNLRGIVLQKLTRFDDALASFQLASLLEPQFAGAHWNEALCRLALGDWQREVWEKFEAGWVIGQRQPRRSFPQPLWLGETPIAGKTILLHDEQGLGDTIQFARFARTIADMGGRVILQVQPSLKRLMQTLDGPHELIADGEPIPSFDVHCPLLSLPLALGLNAHNIPPRPEYLSALPEHSIRLEKDPAAALHVGIAWAGSPNHPHDADRSIPLESLLQVAGPRVRLVSLQKSATPVERETLARHPHVQDPVDQLQDFADTAALIEQLDLVISVSTSVAHLAAAMGKPTWILLSHTPCWRWMLGSEHSVWHPTVRLFRQEADGDWAGVIARVRTALDALT